MHFLSSYDILLRVVLYDYMENESRFLEFIFQASDISIFKEERIHLKSGIHPEYNSTVIKCACGNEISTGSTKSDIRVEICSKCHPFFTGKQKLVDTGGRVERFNRRFKKSQ